VARPEVLDTTFVIRALRREDSSRALAALLRSGRAWLPSVVVGELCAGTRSDQDAEQVRRLVRAMASLGRVLTPSLDDWSRAGQFLARQRRLRGDLDPRDHFADVLIVLTAARIGGTVLTANLRHLATWVEHAVASGLDVTVTRHDAG
jgi:predicted nucleic acid-binding protein